MTEKLSKFLAHRPVVVGPVSRPSIPTTCGVDGCEDPCNVLMVVVRDVMGKDHCGAWSNYARDNHNLRDGYDFVRWIARCGDHYLRNIYASGKGSMSEITGFGYHMHPDDVRAHWDRVEARQAAKS